MCMTGGCGGGKTSSSSKSKMPKNWGGMSMTSGKSKTTGSKFSGSGGFGTPKVKMSFSGKRGK